MERRSEDVREDVREEKGEVPRVVQDAVAEQGSTIVQVVGDLIVWIQESPRFRWGTAGVVLVVAAWFLWWPDGARQSYAQSPPWFEPPASTSPATTPSATVTTTAEVTPPPAPPPVPQPAPQPEVAPAEAKAAVPPETTSAAPAVPRIVIGVGEPTSSSRCEKGKCHWIDTRLTGFAAHTRVSVEPIGNGRSFSRPCVAVTDASGATDCDDTRYDVPGAQVFVYVDTPQGRVESNRITWPS
ncbi:hypothetical protein [Actinosynnema sp. NPDC023587]|uniref:hypothetical protein n=1 Tax=Actinosynnema sp. NPDC023587 TaxID=3154695 RepID=UPI0033E57249